MEQAIPLYSGTTTLNFNFSYVVKRDKHVETASDYGQNSMIIKLRAMVVMPMPCKDLEHERFFCT